MAFTASLTFGESHSAEVTFEETSDGMDLLLGAKRIAVASISGLLLWSSARNVHVSLTMSTAVRPSSCADPSHAVCLVLDRAMVSAFESALESTKLARHGGRCESEG